MVSNNNIQNHKKNKKMNINKVYQSNKNNIMEYKKMN